MSKRYFSPAIAIGLIPAGADSALAASDSVLRAAYCVGVYDALLATELPPLIGANGREWPRPGAMQEMRREILNKRMRVAQFVMPAMLGSNDLLALATATNEGRRREAACMTVVGKPRSDVLECIQWAKTNPCNDLSWMPY